MSSANHIDIVKKIYEALNQNDIATIFKYFDPDIKRVEFKGTPMAGSFAGYADVKVHFETGRSTWAEGSCYPERLVTEGDTVIAFVHVRVRLKDKSDWNEGRVVDTFTFRNSKVIEMRSFLKSEEALQWVGLKE